MCENEYRLPEIFYKYFTKALNQQKSSVVKNVLIFYIKYRIILRKKILLHFGINRTGNCPKMGYSLSHISNESNSNIHLISNRTLILNLLAI